MDVDRSTLFYIIILFIFLSLPSRPQEPSTTRERDQLATLQDEIRYSNDILSNSSYGSGYGNLTGFRLSYLDSVEGRNISDWPFHDVWSEDERYSILPNEVSQKVSQFWNVEKLSQQEDPSSYMLNITGRVRGEFTKSETEVSDIFMPLPKYLQSFQEDREQDDDNADPDVIDPSSDFTRPLPKSRLGTDDVWRMMQDNRPGNVTDTRGTISFDIRNNNYETFKDRENPIKNAVFVDLVMSISDFQEINSHDVTTRGVYFQDSGALLTVSRSGKFLGYHGLPHLALSEADFETAKTLVLQQFNKTDIERDINVDYMGDLVAKADQCEYIAYVQFNKTELSKDQLKVIDDELKAPLGRPVEHIPQLQIKRALLYSPDCGVVLEVNDAIGMRKEVQYKQLKTFLFGLMVLLTMQLFFSIRQMNATNTPSTLYKISFYSIGLLNFADGILAMMFLLMSAIVGELYLILVCCAFITFILASIFETRYMILIYQVQANERGSSWWDLLRGATNMERDEENIGEAAGNADTEAGTLLPIAQRRTATPAVVPTEANISGAIYGRFFFMLITTSFLILNSLMWRFQYRRIFEAIGLFITYSFWVPQFFRNTLRGSRRSFRWEFVVGTSVIRLIPVAYLCLLPNPLNHHYDPYLIGVLVWWVTIQNFALYLQEIFGARFWLNERWLPKSYDYHPVLNLTDLENGGFSDEIMDQVREDEHIHSISTDCAICMTKVDVALVANRSVGLMERRNYMVTPCRHIFHSECLEGWMRYKLQCPVCRNSLPPI